MINCNYIRQCSDYDDGLICTHCGNNRPQESFFNPKECPDCGRKTTIHIARLLVNNKKETYWQCECGWSRKTESTL